YTNHPLTQTHTAFPTQIIHSHKHTQPSLNLYLPIKSSIFLVTHQDLLSDTAEPPPPRRPPSPTAVRTRPPPPRPSAATAAKHKGPWYSHLHNRRHQQRSGPGRLAISALISL